MVASSRLLIGVVLGSVVCAADTSYSRDVRPILQRQCQGCHQPNLKSSNLDLTTYEGLMAGGKRRRRPEGRVLAAESCW